MIRIQFPKICAKHLSTNLVLSATYTLSKKFQQAKLISLKSVITYLCVYSYVLNDVAFFSHNMVLNIVIAQTWFKFKNLVERGAVKRCYQPGLLTVMRIGPPGCGTPQGQIPPPAAFRIWLQRLLGLQHSEYNFVDSSPSSSILNMISDIVRPPAFGIWFQRFLRLQHSEYDFRDSSAFSIRNMISEIPPPPAFGIWFQRFLRLQHLEYDFWDSSYSSLQNMTSEIVRPPAFRIWFQRLLGLQHSEYDFRYC